MKNTITLDPVQPTFRVTYTYAWPYNLVRSETDPDFVHTGGSKAILAMTKRFLAKSGPTFFIVSLAWKCDETNLSYF